MRNTRLINYRCVFPEIVDYDEYLAAFGPKWPEASERSRGSRGAERGGWRAVGAARGRGLPAACLLPPSAQLRLSPSPLLSPLEQIEGWFDLEGIRAAFEAVDFVGEERRGGSDVGRSGGWKAAAETALAAAAAPDRCSRSCADDEPAAARRLSLAGQLVAAAALRGAQLAHCPAPATALPCHRPAPQASARTWRSSGWTSSPATWSG